MRAKFFIEILTIIFPSYAISFVICLFPGGLGRNRKRKLKSNWTIRHFVSSLDKSSDEINDTRYHPLTALDPFPHLLSFKVTRWWPRRVRLILPAVDREIHANNDGHRRERFSSLCWGPEPGSHKGTDEVNSLKSEAQSGGLCPVPYLFLEYGTH